MVPNKDEICNVVGSSIDKPPRGASWKKFWEIETNEKWPKKCCICSADFEEVRSVGGHVYVKGRRTGKDQFIVPICVGCNNNRKIDYHILQPKRTEWATIKEETIAALRN